MATLGEIKNIPMMGATGFGEALCFLAAIDLLCSEEANSLTFVADNAGFDGPNSKVICNGAWTDYEDLDFSAETAFEALKMAAQAYNAKAGA